MGVGLHAVTVVGVGNFQVSSSASTVPVQPHASTQPGDLVVAAAAVSVAGGPSIARDLGDGWQFLASHWDSGTNAGLILAALVANRPGSTGYAGIGLPASGAFYGHCVTYRGPKWDVGGARGSGTASFDSSNGSASDAPEGTPPYAQCLDVIARSCAAGASSPTADVVAGFTERVDGGSNNGLKLTINDRTIAGHLYCPAVTSALSANRTNRVGVRAFIPTVGDALAAGRRYGQPRRLG